MENLSPVAKNRHGQVIHSDKKQCIINIYKTVVTENPRILKDNAVRKVAESVGVGKSTVYRILSNYKKNHVDGIKSPENKKTRPCMFEKIDNFTKCAVRRKVHDFFLRNEQPTVEMVMNSVNDDSDLPNFKRTSFYGILKKLGFTFTTRKRNMFLSDRDDIILWRRNYLRKIKRFREEGRPIYFQDETWVNEGHTKSKIWVDSHVKSRKDAFLNGLSTGLKNPSGKGKRLILSHFGNENGFVKDASLIFQSKSKGDYHQEMNGDVFLNHFRQVLPKLNENAVIVIDNAPYHSTKVEKLPTSSWNKNQLMEWLTEKGVAVDKSLLKKELLQLAYKEKPKYDKYVIDEEAKRHNKTVLRLPPYHCELNPIELIWAQVKGYVSKRNKTFKLPEVKSLFEEGLNSVTAHDWEKCVEHVKNEEKKLWKLDDIIEEMEEETRRCIINLDDDDSDDSVLAEELPVE